MIDIYSKWGNYIPNDLRTEFAKDSLDIENIQDQMTQNEKHFYNNIGRIADALEKIQSHVNRRTDSEAEARFKIINDMQTEEISKLKLMLHEEGVELCANCQEEIATDGSFCDDCKTP